MSDIRFTKLQGLGNDFLLIRTEDTRAIEGAGDLARRMCDRNFGAGADGVVFVGASSNSDAIFLPAYSIPTAARLKSREMGLGVLPPTSTSHGCGRRPKFGLLPSRV